MIKRVLVVSVTVLLFAAAGFAQDGRVDVSVSGAAVFSKKTTGNGTTLTPTQNAGVIASFALHTSSATALQINFGHSDNSQNYLSSGLHYRVKTTLTEFSGAFVVTPIRTDRYRAFVFGGAGGLVFNPNSALVEDTPQAIGGVRQTRVGILYGGGIDYGLITHLSLRLQYRGLIYSPPDFKVSGFFTGGHGHLAEPAVGLVFTF
jgi:opacity protein-like surface antigen